jgi:hypothetical protein
MLLLSAPFDEAPQRRESRLGAALLQASAGALVLLGMGLAAMVWGGSVGPLGRALMGAATHAGFLALGWALILDGAAGWRRPALRLAVLLVLVALLSRATAWGAALYAIVPIALVAEARRWRQSTSAGIVRPKAIAVVLGAAAGGFLGAHLLITSALTFGYVVRIESAGAYLGAIAYDVGASALSAEWLFRGALFSRWWRYWPFAPAAALSTACTVLRYLLDPNLPVAVETRLGAIFYMGLLSFASCALRAWSGSLVPGYLATVAFFVAYRTLSN